MRRLGGHGAWDEGSIYFDTVGVTDSSSVGPTTQIVALVRGPRVCSAPVTDKVRTALQTGTIPRGRLSRSPHRSRRSRCPRSISDNLTRAPRLKSANHLRRAGPFAHGRRTQT